MLEKGVVKATEGSEEETFVIIKKTPAQLAFEKMQEKRVFFY